MVRIDIAISNWTNVNGDERIMRKKGEDRHRSIDLTNTKVNKRRISEEGAD